MIKIIICIAMLFSIFYEVKKCDDKSRENKKKEDEIKQSIEKNMENRRNNPDECPICFCDIMKLNDNVYCRYCNYVFHRECIKTYIQYYRFDFCPLCITPVKYDDFITLPRCYGKVQNNFGPLGSN